MLQARAKARFDARAAMMRARYGQPAAAKALTQCERADCGVCEHCCYVAKEPYSPARWRAFKALSRRDPIGRESKYGELERDLYRLRPMSSWELITDTF
jgi:hypothetical protein